MTVVALKCRWSTWVVYVDPPGTAGGSVMVWIDGDTVPGGGVTGREIEPGGHLSRKRWYFFGASPEWPFPPWVRVTALTDPRRAGITPPPAPRESGRSDPDPPPAPPSSRGGRQPT